MHEYETTKDQQASQHKSVKKVQFNESSEPSYVSNDNYSNAAYLIQKNKQLRSEWEESDKKFRRYNPSFNKQE